MSDSQQPAFGQPLKIEPGGFYVIELQERASPDTIAKIKQQLKPYEEQYGCRFMVLDAGMKIARQSQAAEPAPTDMPR